MTDIVVKTSFYIANILLSAYFMSKSVQYFKKEKYFGFGLYTTSAIIYIIFIAELIFRG